MMLFRKIIVLMIALIGCLIACSKKNKIQPCPLMNIQIPKQTICGCNTLKREPPLKYGLQLPRTLDLNSMRKAMAASLLKVHQMSAKDGGVWSLRLQGDLHGRYYTYQIKHNNSWLEETPGIYAKAVGVNGQRAMVLDFKTTQSCRLGNWIKRPKLEVMNEAIVYELHVRDMTIHPASGSSYPGKYLGLVEEGNSGT